MQYSYIYKDNNILKMNNFRCFMNDRLDVNKYENDNIDENIDNIL